MFVVWVSISTIHICPIGLHGLDLGADARTITEQRSIMERFDTPGTFQLHQNQPGNDKCRACHAASEAIADSRDAPADGLMTDFTQRVALAPQAPPLPGSGTWQAARQADQAGRRGEVVRIDLPPPRWSA